MLIRLRKNIQTSLLFYLLYLLVFTLLFLSAGHEFMHNHEPDTEEHHDCPAYQIGILLNSLIIYYFFFAITSLFILFLRFQRTRIIGITIRRDIDARAPPLYY